ncbi:type II toxin-antitoxin system RelE/ParE family toxin [Bifidobacterium olomucense]|uniref:Toxin RelE n=1 Tax=Bifidobacterium olomucense TaxID=2675324 RepID=A0A7Y0EXY3_9BIFI|nr:type II toxin-antitoxin system RelE/ParE family toxin [Bifidobacterium sp. DSM 109959]NMM97391.1 toxin RelE [Bifidobacterium sp. DSM 109959]
MLHYESKRKVSFEIYINNDGSSPFEDWYRSLPAKDAHKLDALIERIEYYGIPTALRMQWVKKLDNEIWEIRSQQSNNIQRACYFHFNGIQYIITHGFTKKTQKTPRPEIERAHRIKNLYEQEEH